MTRKTAKTLSRADQIMLRAVSSNGPEYTIDRDGNRVRKASAECPVEREDVIFLLKNRRVVEVEEVLEMVGTGVMKFLLNKQYLVESNGLYWVTERAAQNYDLPRKVAGMGTIKFLKLEG